MSKKKVIIAMVIAVSGCDWIEARNPCTESELNLAHPDCDYRAKIVIEQGVAICRCQQ